MTLRSRKYAAALLLLLLHRVLLLLHRLRHRRLLHPLRPLHP